MASVIHSEKGKKKKTNLKAYREITEDNVLNAFALTLIELKNVCFLHLKKKNLSSKCGHLNFLHSKFSAWEYFMQDSENLLFI